MQATTVSGNTFSAYTSNIAMTLDHMYKSGVFTDIISKGNPLFAKLKSKGKSSVSGGRQVAIDLMYGLSSNVNSYSDLDDLDITRQDGHTQVFTKWAQYHGALVFSGHEMNTNRGKEQAQSLVKNRVKQLLASFSDRMNRDLWDITPEGTTTGNGGKNITSIPQIVPCNTKDIDLYGIDMSETPAFANKTYDFGGDMTPQAFTDGLRRLYLDTTKSLGGAPDMSVCDYNSYDLYLAAMDRKIQYTDWKDADIGFASVKCMGSDLYPDEHVPDTEHAVNWDSNEWTNGSFYFLNTQFLELLFLAGRDFKPGKQLDAINKDGVVTNYFAECQLVTNHRAKHGVAFDLAATLS